MSVAVASFQAPMWRTLLQGHPHTGQPIRCPHLPLDVTADQVAEVLVAARAELSGPGRWTQGCLARFSGYEPTGDPDFLKIVPRANVQGFCAMGAVIWSAFWAAYPQAVVTACEDVLRACLPRHECIEPWNDDFGRTQVEVVDLFSRALVLVTRGELWA